MLVVGVNLLLSEQFFVHVLNVGNVDRFETLSVSFLPLFGHSFQGYLAGRLRQEVQKASIVGWSFTKLGRRYQVAEPARLFKDFGWTWGEVGNPRLPT